MGLGARGPWVLTLHLLVLLLKGGWRILTSWPRKTHSPTQTRARGRHVHTKSHQGRYTQAQTERQTAGPTHREAERQMLRETDTPRTSRPAAPGPHRPIRRTNKTPLGSRLDAGLSHSWVSFKGPLGESLTGCLGQGGWGQWGRLWPDQEALGADADRRLLRVRERCPEGSGWAGSERARDVVRPRTAASQNQNSLGLTQPPPPTRAAPHPASSFRPSSAPSPLPPL